MLGMNDRLRIVIFFALILGLVFCIGRTRLPLAHEWLDPVAIRDSGTVFSYLASQPSPIRALVLGTLQHVEGPLQYILINLYSLTVGDVFPLNPRTMQFPNTIFAFLASLFAFLICKKLFSVRMAFYCAAAFALFPWLAVTIRVPWYLNTVSCLLHFSTFYFFACFINEPNSLFYKIAAPISLTLYILTGLDWPTYIFCLLVFLLLSGRFWAVLRNPVQCYTCYCHFVSVNFYRNVSHKIWRGGSPIFAIGLPVLAIRHGCGEIHDGKALAAHDIAQWTAVGACFCRASRVCVPLQKATSAGQIEQKLSRLDVSMACIGHAAADGVLRISAIFVRCSYAHGSAGGLFPFENPRPFRRYRIGPHDLPAILLCYGWQFPV